jgi:SAM-dependent methyltransferase
MTSTSKMCPICQNDSRQVYSNMPGYSAGLAYSIFVCTDCDTSFADPMDTHSSVYDGIYNQASILPGYERYVRYAELVKKTHKPLEVLKNSEVSYWSVINTIQSVAHKKTDIKILEVGSGLGYLTYALNKAGYSTHGIDISPSAVEQAKSRYGDYFDTKNLFDIACETERYDFVVMMDVIEHVSNPTAFIAEAKKVLKPSGKLLVTTPNKSFAPPNSIWLSDVPPVHLYFLTENALVHIARTLNMQCSFFDFTHYTRIFASIQFDGSLKDLLAGLPRLNSDGTVRAAIAQTSLKTRFLGVRIRHWLSYWRRKIKPKNVSSRSIIMCAILSNN